MALPLITIEGRAVIDPELRFSPNGVAIAKFRVVASSQKKNEATGTWEDDKTLWINVTCFKQLAEHVAESVAKGDLITVVGRLQTNAWETKEGEKRSVIECIANSVAASLLFRNIPHSAGRVERGNADSAPADNDPWAAQTGANPEEPPF